MKISSLLRREKTLPASKTTTTFNAPGTYIPPYGKTSVKVTGRGGTGNPATYPYAGTNPGYEAYGGTNPYYPGFTIYMPGNISGYNPQNINGYNPPTPGNYAGTNPGNYAGEALVGYTVSDSNYSYTVYNYQPYYNPPAPYYNPPTPGNAIYNPSYPNYNPSYYESNPGSGGNPYYYYVSGNAYYNYVAGNPGAPTTVSNVTFPGGGEGSVGPVVPLTTTNIQYVNSAGFTVTVPPGGYITIQND